MADSLASKVTRLKSLALDIDRDAEDQNRYLDGMVRSAAGLGLRKRDRPAHGERKALFHNGTVWARQPEASVLCGHGPDRGLLHPLLPPVEGKDVSQGSWLLWVPRAATAFPHLVSRALADLLQNTPLKWWLWSRNLPVWLGGHAASEWEPCVPGPHV
ncbi:BET1-like protein isoform X2 [Desmodus rotundus]|nr:BET1-like protein isoform X2 [Desmodus rotundus]